MSAVYTPILFGDLVRFQIFGKPGRSAGDGAAVGNPSKNPFSVSGRPRICRPLLVDDDDDDEPTWPPGRETIAPPPPACSREDRVSEAESCTSREQHNGAPLVGARCARTSDALNTVVSHKHDVSLSF